MKRADFRSRMQVSSLVYITSGPDVLDLGATSAVIGWELSQPASGVIEYGTTTAYGATTDSNTHATSHQVNIPPQGGTALSAGTTYHYRISGADENGNTYDSGDRTFTTVSTGTVDFLARPVSGALVYDGVTNVLIENTAIRLGSVNNPVGQGIIIRNVNGSITIRDVDIADCQGGIYITNCTGTVLIDNLRSRNIGTKTATNSDIGSGKSNHIQFASNTLSGYVRNSKFLGGRTEDMLSTWRTRGVGVGQELIFEDNELQGLVADTATARAWDSASGTGIIVSDGSGTSLSGYIIVRRNTFLTPGQVGIQHIDGPGLQTYDNIIYGQQRAQSNRPIASWEGTPVGVVYDNTYYWLTPTGEAVGPWLHQDPSGLVLTNNTEDAGLDPNDYVVTL